MSDQTISPVTPEKLQSVLLEALEGIAFAQNLADVNCAAGAAWDELRGVTDCPAGCGCAPCVEFDRKVAAGEIVLT